MRVSLEAAEAGNCGRSVSDTKSMTTWRTGRIPCIDSFRQSCQDCGGAVDFLRLLIMVMVMVMVVVMVMIMVMIMVMVMVVVMVMVMGRIPPRLGCTPSGTSSG